MPFYRGVPLTVKSLSQKDYRDDPQTLGDHLKKRRQQLGLLQREAAARMGVSADTIVNWENDKTKPVSAQFRPVVIFLGYDPTGEPKTLAERLAAKQRSLGASHAQIARHLGWDPGTLRRYISGAWRISPNRRASLEEFLNAEDAALVGLHSLKRRR